MTNDVEIDEDLEDQVDPQLIAGDLWIGVPQAASVGGIPERTIYNWTAESGFPTRVDGRRTLVSMSKVVERIRRRHSVDNSPGNQAPASSSASSSAGRRANGGVTPPSVTAFRDRAALTDAETALMSAEAQRESLRESLAAQRKEVERAARQRLAAIEADEQREHLRELERLVTVEATLLAIRQKDKEFQAAIAWRTADNLLGALVDDWHLRPAVAEAFSRCNWEPSVQPPQPIERISVTRKEFDNGATTHSRHSTHQAEAERLESQMREVAWRELRRFGRRQGLDADELEVIFEDRIESALLVSARELEVGGAHVEAILADPVGWAREAVRLAFDDDGAWRSW